MRAGLAGATLLLTAATLAPQAAHADPPLFTKAEYGQVTLNDLKSHIETDICGCSGRLMATTEQGDGSIARTFWYTNPIGGIVYLRYRQAFTGGRWLTWDKKGWCGPKTGDCDYVKLVGP